MAAPAGPLPLDAAMQLLALARQDIELDLAIQPDWLALRRLDGVDEGDASRERVRLTAQLAVVPAYRAHQRISDAMESLATQSKQHLAARENGWVGGLSARIPSLQELSAAQGRSRRARLADLDPQSLSNWQARTGGDDPWIENRSAMIDLDHVIALIRRGAASHRPRRLYAMIDGGDECEARVSGGEANQPSAAGAQAEPRSRLPARQAIHEPQPEAVPLVPINARKAASTREETPVEVITLVEDILGTTMTQSTALPASLHEPVTAVAEGVETATESVAPGSVPMHEATAVRLDAMEAEIDILSQEAARSPPPRQAGLPSLPDFDPATVDLTEAVIEIVKKPQRAAVLEALPELELTPGRNGRVEVAASERPETERTGTAAFEAGEATVEIVRRDISVATDLRDGPLRDGGPDENAQSAVRRFMAALQGKDAGRGDGSRGDG